MKAEIRTPIQYRNAHSLIVAGSGAGKTIRLLFLALQMAPLIRGLWLFDMRKRETRKLRPYFQRLGRDLIIVRGRQLKLNPLQVPTGMDPADWITRCADMLIGVLGLPPRASKLIQVTLFRLYRQAGVFDGGQLYPTLFDLRDALANDKGANPPARAAIIDSLDPLLLSLGPDVLAYRRGWVTTDLVGQAISFEFDGNAEVEKDLLLNALIVSEFSSRVARGVSNPRMNLWIGVDEAQRLCGARRTSGQPGPIADLIGLIRGTGIGLDLSVQSSADVSPHIISNTSTKVIGRCGSIADYTDIGRAMGLTAEQIHWAQLNLTPGVFIGQTGEGRWRKPFVFRVPRMDFKQERSSSTPSPHDIGPLKQLPAVSA